MKRTVFFISDSTGITAETLGKSLLNQFDNIDFNQVIIPYVDSPAKAETAVTRVNSAFDNDGVQPIIFDTVINPEIREILSTSRGYMMDILSTFLVPLEKMLGSQSSYRVGKVPGTTTNDRYISRINAVHYALDNDDGSSVNHYDKADLILIGVSRSGKTPSCLYLAMQFGIFAANYPITEEDLESGQLPKSLIPYKTKLFGLTIDPERLCAIRSERKPNSRYASLSQCEYEIRGVEAMLRRNAIALVNTTDFSVEEIAARILNETGIDRRS